MPLSAADRLDILDLLARYNYAHDFDDVDAYVACFAPDGVLKTSRATHTGHEALREFFLHSGERLPNVRHWVENVVIEGDKGRATAASYLLLLDLNAAPYPRLTGRYQDELRRVDGAWKFAARTISVDGR